MSWFTNWTAGDKQTYRRRTADVPAFRYGHETEPEWFRDAASQGWLEEDHGKLKLKNGENMQFAWTGDWILLRKGYCAAVHHDEFVEHYEPTPKYAKLMA